MFYEKDCELLIQNRDAIKKVYPWDSGLLHLCCAAIYASKGKAVDTAVLEECKTLLKKQTGVFSNFRSTAKMPITSLLALSPNPEETLENGLQVYHMLKQEFMTSAYLPLTAMIIGQMADPIRYEEIVARTRRIYKSMKSEHPFLTSSEDSAFCALLALSEKSDEELIRDMETCFELLKPEFFSANSVQALSHTLALIDGEPEYKVEQTMKLFKTLKERGHKYGTSHELPSLGVLALSGANVEAIADEIIEIDQWLSKQKGFGIFGSVSKKQRLMYAGMLAGRRYFDDDAMQTAAVNATISLIIAEQLVLCSCIAASSAAASSSASN